MRTFRLLAVDGKFTKIKITCPHDKLNDLLIKYYIISTRTYCFENSVLLVTFYNYLASLLVSCHTFPARTIFLTDRYV